jgi:hypothetical protein
MRCTRSARCLSDLDRDVDHMRTTSIPSSHGTFTNHLHISRQLDRGLSAGGGSKAAVRGGLTEWCRPVQT